MKKKLSILLLLIFITLPTLLPFFNSKFFYTQDYIFIARLNQMSAALSDGQFPVRWAPDLRFGEPIFNYYAPLPYYIGALIHLFGFNFLWVAKILFILSAFFSAVAMYIFASRLFGKKAGILAASLYTYAPYRAVDIYVRGSLSETWAFIFFPLIFYTSFLVSKKRTAVNVCWLALSLVGLFLTHNVTTLMFLPFLLIWWIYLIIKEKKISIVLYLAAASVLAVGLSAFFLLPSFFERDFIQTKYLIVGYFNFRAHFVALQQFFSLFWGYGSSLWGPNDGLSFQVGIVNWIILGLAALSTIIFRKDKKLIGLLLVLGFSFLLSVSLQHNKSAFIWEAIPLMAFIQFPWRFLAISVFIVAIIGAAITPYLKQKFIFLYFILIVLSLVSTISYFRPKEYVDDSFFDKFLNKETMRRGVDLTKDYLPIWVQTTEVEYFDKLKVEKGEAVILDFQKRSNLMQGSIDVKSPSLVEVPIAYFPGWEVRANNKLIAELPPSNRGLIRFELPKGTYQIKIELKDTPIRTVGNIISVVSLLLFAILIFGSKRALRLENVA